MKKEIYIFILVIFLFLIIPPVVVEIIFGNYMVFSPHLFMNAWLSFTLSTTGLIISFILLYVIWERRKNIALTQVDRKILIFHLTFYKTLTQKCIDLANEYPHNGKTSEDVNKNIRGKLKGIDNFGELILILKSGSYKNYNPEFALTLEELEIQGLGFIEEIKKIMIFTSKDSKGLKLLSEFHEFLNLHKKRLEMQHVT